MTGFASFLRKELSETLRTWRIWVVPGIMLAFAVMSPIFAQITPLILKSVASSQPGVVIKLPPQTYADAYAQWLKNLTQIVVFAVIIASSGMVSAEKKAGTVILVLTKPISRAAFVVAKAVSNLTLLAAATVVGTAVCWAGTLALFGKAPLGPLVSATLLWFTFAAMMVCVMALLSVVIGGQAGAAGAGLGVYAFLSIVTLWPASVVFTPAGLLPMAGAAITGVSAVGGIIAVVSGVALGVACVAAATVVFEGQEL